jgi:hypothetical protein
MTIKLKTPTWDDAENFAIEEDVKLIEFPFTSHGKKVSLAPSVSYCDYDSEPKIILIGISQCISRQS